MLASGGGGGSSGPGRDALPPPPPAAPRRGGAAPGQPPRALPTARALSRALLQRPPQRPARCSLAPAGVTAPRPPRAPPEAPSTRPRPFREGSARRACPAVRDPLRWDWLARQALPTPCLLAESPQAPSRPPLGVATRDFLYSSSSGLPAPCSSRSHAPLSPLSRPGPLLVGLARNPTPTT